MKINDSLFTRRRFLNTLLGGWFASFLAVFVYPIVKFAFPPYQEPDQVDLPFSEFADMDPNTVRNFFWGNKPGILKKNDDSTYTAFVAVCTHLDCNITYMADQRKFFCACHDGWYDENGNNIGGPPPRPLRSLQVVLEKDMILIKKTGE
jgi:cytochrome b6-f complex iron-sulfur subunit